MTIEAQRRLFGIIPVSRWREVGSGTLFQALEDRLGQDFLRQSLGKNRIVSYLRVPDKDTIVIGVDSKVSRRIYPRKINDYRTGYRTLVENAINSERVWAPIPNIFVSSAFRWRPSPKNQA